MGLEVTAKATEWQGQLDGAGGLDANKRALTDAELDALNAEFDRFAGVLGCQVKRIGMAMDNNTFGHRGIQAGSAFCWLYKSWAEGNPERGIAKLPDNARVVEIGCGGCHSLGYLCDAAPPGWTIYSIDPYPEPGRFRGWVEDVNKYLHDVIDRVNFLRCYSPRAADLFDDGSLDAVLIDGDHDYGPVLADIKAWWPKLKSGGYLGGDDCDAMFPGCVQAWDEAFPEVVVYGSTACVRKP